MADRPTPNRKFNWGAVSKNLVFWLLIILVPIAFYQMVGSSREEFIEVSYSTFRRELEQGNIAQVQITSGKFVKGEFKAPVPVEGKQVERFSVILPIQDSELFIKRLEDRGVPIDAKEPKPSFG